jgi:hypothetical protein
MKRNGKSAKRRFEQIKVAYREDYQRRVKKAMKQRELRGLPVDVINLSAQLKPAQKKAFSDIEVYISRMLQLGRQPKKITIQAKHWDSLSAIANSKSLTYKGITLTK